MCSANESHFSTTSKSTLSARNLRAISERKNVSFSCSTCARFCTLSLCSKWPFVSLCCVSVWVSLFCCKSFVSSRLRFKSPRLHSPYRAKTMNEEYLATASAEADFYTPYLYALNYERQRICPIIQLVHLQVFLYWLLRSFRKSRENRVYRNSGPRGNRHSTSRTGFHLFHRA